MKHVVSIGFGVLAAAFILWVFSELNKALRVTESTVAPSYDDDYDWW